MLKRFRQSFAAFRSDQRGVIFVEYLVLLTIAGIGVIAGIAAIRGALINELLELADAINAITT